MTSTTTTGSDMKWIPDLLSPKEHSSTRDGFGKGLVELGQLDENLWVLTADVSESTRTHWFAEKFPKRFVQTGVAEQNMAGTAAGIASCGKTVFISAFGAFSPGRNWDQIRVSICYSNLDVKIHASHTGITVGPDGASHQILEDLALMRSLPHMRVVVPSDAEAMRKAVLAAGALRGPVYLRSSREKTPVFSTKDTPFEIGKANVCLDGSDLAIFACGITVYQSIKAAYELKNAGISAAVIDCHTIKPLDRALIMKYAKKCGGILTAEEHQIVGGLGSAVAEAVCAEYPVPVYRHGMYDCFGESGEGWDLIKKYGLDAPGIVKAAKEAMKKRQ